MNIRPAWGVKYGFWAQELLSPNGLGYHGETGSLWYGQIAQLVRAFGICPEGPGFNPQSGHFYKFNNEHSGWCPIPVQHDPTALWVGLHRHPSSRVFGLSSSSLLVWFLNLNLKYWLLHVSCISKTRKEKKWHQFIWYAIQFEKLYDKGRKGNCSWRSTSW